VDYKHTLLVVSHDRGFLNEVCTDIMEFKRKKLTYYRGNFDTYVRLRDENIRNAMRLFQAYESKREHMMEFINKFRAKAGRASMVQSRVKAVEKMDLDAPEAVEIDRVWRFSIPNSEPLSSPIIAINDVSFDYNPMLEDGSKKPESEMLLNKVNFGVDLTSRIAILGANGQGKLHLRLHVPSHLCRLTNCTVTYILTHIHTGKTTLLNLIMGKINPIKGGVAINGGLRIGHFTQHSSGTSCRVCVW
jgi:ATP-binding cassette subfamily F protein 3